MPTGRRDGRISQASQVNLPGPTMSVAQATSAFTAKGLTQNDMVTLLGTQLTIFITQALQKLLSKSMLHDFERNLLTNLE
jgi:hypothetical protein